MISVKAILFDFDGVLADSFERLYALAKTAMAETKVALSRNQYRNFFMGNVHQAYRDYLTDSEDYECFSAFRRERFETYYARVKLFPGVARLVRELEQRYMLAIVSSGHRGAITKLLATSGLENSFRFIQAGAEYSKERSIQCALKRFRVPPSKAVLVSDTCGDLITARTVRMPVIGVGWGFHSLRRLRHVRPDAVARNIHELRAYFL